jgi:hypothetical protein
MLLKILDTVYIDDDVDIIAVAYDNGFDRMWVSKNGCHPVEITLGRATSEEREAFAARINKALQLRGQI